MFETNERLKVLMRENNLNRRQVARLLSVTFVAVNWWLTNKRKMSIQLLELLQYKIKDKMNEES